MNYFDFTAQFNNMGASAVSTVVNAYTTVTGLFAVTAGTAAVAGPASVNFCLSNPERCANTAAAIGSGVIGAFDEAANVPDATQNPNYGILELISQAGVEKIKELCEQRK